MCVRCAFFSWSSGVCGAGRFFSGAENRRDGRFFLEQKIGVMGGFFWSRK